MKRYIYIIVFVFASLFSQAFGAQYESPTFYDTICAEPDARNLQMSDLKTLISIFLYDREDSIWLEYGNTVKVELGDITGHVIENDTSLFDTLSGEKINATKTIQLDVEYTRKLVFSKIPSTENEAQKTSATLALWHIFGKLLSETDTERVTKISDEASITTVHHATFFYRFELVFPENIDFKIQGDSCLVDNQIILSVDSAYLPYTLKWQAEGMDPVDASGSSVKFESKSDENYFYSVLCTATACRGETRSATFVIGKPTPKPTIEDISCIAANETSFDVEVKEPDSRFSYHWTVEDFGNGKIIDTQQGALATMTIPQNESVKLKLVSTGGCRASDAVTQVLHRSVGTGNIQLQGDTNCVFVGDTLRFVLQNAPQDSLVWKSETGKETLLGNAEFICNTTGLNTTSFKVSVSNKNCPESVDSNTFNIREDFRVSLGTSPMCISANEYQVIKLTSNGINPEVHWYGNGVEIDSTTYKKEDSIRLRLTNPGDQNLYVKVTAKECGRERDTLLVLRPKPEMPSLDPLWGMLTPCIPLGIDTTIELRVQPQEGVKFRWSIMEEEITELDSNSIPFRVNYKLPDRNTPIPVSVYAYTEGCHNGSEPFSTTLYATGAGLDEEWDLLQVPFELSFLGSSIIVGYNISFSDDGMEKEDDPFEGRYIYYWYSNDIDIVESDRDVYAYFVDIPENDTVRLFCRLTNEEKQCYSVYSINVIDMADQQDVLFTAMKGEDAVNSKGTEVLQAQVSFEKEDMPCPGIVLKPNPVHSGTQVKVEGICETESFIVECYSPQGRLMFRTTAKGDTFTLPTDNYAAGVYIVKIQLNGAAAPVVKKLIIL